MIQTPPKRKYKKRLLRRCIHDFKSDVINNMDHMRISGTEPSLVILSQKSSFKKWKVMSLKCQKQADAKRDGVLQFQSVLTRKILMLSKRYESTVEFGSICPRDSLVHQQATLFNVTVVTSGLLNSVIGLCVFT